MRATRTTALAVAPLLLVLVVAAVVLGAGGDRTPPRAVAGTYATSPDACLGGALTLKQSGRYVDVTGGRSGALTLRGDHLTGDVSCPGAKRRLDARVTPTTLNGTLGGRPLRATLRAPATTKKKVAARTIDDKTIGAVFLAIAAIMLATRVIGGAVARAGQPRVMGEVLAGILLGPTLLGALLPGVKDALFPADIIPYLTVVADLGLVFFMFLIGMEIDLAQLRGRAGQMLAVASASVAVPLSLGLLAAAATFSLVGPDTRFAAYALFLAVAMAITAFPVLARILVERRMLRSSVGTMAIGAAVINDVVGWFLVALAAAVAASGPASTVLRTIALALAFSAGMIGLVRLAVARAAVAFDEAGRLPAYWTALLFGGVLMAAYVTEEIGVSVIFGGFLMGAVMPRHAGLTEDVTRRVEDYVLLVLLPVFFAVTGLKTDIGLLGRPELLAITAGLLVVAVAGKAVGTYVAARGAGMDGGEARVLGVLMNTRGLTELVVLNLALTADAISDSLFAAMVVVALVTTFMAAPLLRVVDPRGRFAEQLPDVAPVVETPEHAIVVAPQSPGALARLRAIAEPLARSQPPRELVLARLLPLERGAGVRAALDSAQRRLRDATGELDAARAELAATGVAARAVAFTSPRPGEDLVRLAEPETVDLLLVDGRRPLLGSPVPRGDVGRVLDAAPCDVAVLVAREGVSVAVGPGAIVAVPFGGSDHDWGALELAAWLAAGTGATLRLIGRTAEDDEERDASRLLGNASLLVQRIVGVAAEPVLAEPGAAGIVAAIDGAALAVAGLADDWRTAGLGPVRTQLASAAAVPLLFVRRGERPGALAPAGDVTRFGWSIVA